MKKRSRVAELSLWCEPCRRLCQLLQNCRVYTAAQLHKSGPIRGEMRRDAVMSLVKQLLKFLMGKKERERERKERERKRGREGRCLSVKTKEIDRGSESI